jgi:phosphate transport system permease protein
MSFQRSIPRHAPNSPEPGTTHSPLSAPASVTPVSELRDEAARMDGRRARQDRLFEWVCLGALALPLVVLGLFFLNVFATGVGRISVDFLTGYPSRKAELAGILPPLVGSLWLMGLTALIAIPVGVGAAIYLEEYARPGKLTAFIELNIANLAGVPSIIYGLLGLEIFVRVVGLGRSVLAGALTLSLLLLPMVIIASREALRTVPAQLREACYAMGAEKWQTLQGVVLPMCAPGIMTGIILSLARAIGETAPLVTIGALTFVAFLPDGPSSPFTALPIQIFNWISRPQTAFHVNAAAGIVVLLCVLMVLNGAAIYLRGRLAQRR